MFFKIRKTTENYSFRLFYQINCRPTKADKNSEELLAADRHVEKYKDVLDKICRKFLQNPSSSSSNTNAVNVDQDVREKRCKKVHEYKLAQAMEESLNYLPDGLLHDVLENCGEYDLTFVDTFNWTNKELPSLLCATINDEGENKSNENKIIVWNISLQLNWRSISPMKLLTMKSTWKIMLPKKWH